MMLLCCMMSIVDSNVFKLEPHWGLEVRISGPLLYRFELFFLCKSLKSLSIMEV